MKWCCITAVYVQYFYLLSFVISLVCMHIAYEKNEINFISHCSEAKKKKDSFCKKKKKRRKNEFTRKNTFYLSPSLAHTSEWESIWQCELGRRNGGMKKWINIMNISWMREKGQQKQAGTSSMWDIFMCALKLAINDKSKNIP